MKRLIASVTIIASLSFAVFHSIPGVSNLTRWALGQDTSRPWIIIFRDDSTGKMTSYWVKGSTHESGSSQAPVVLLGDNKTLPEGQYTYTLDGSSSYSPSGTSFSSYSWSVVSGSGATFATPSAISTDVTLIAGVTYIFKLTITDADGNAGTGTVQISTAALATNEYFVSAVSKVNFSPTPQTIPGFVNVYGNPNTGVITTSIGNGWTFSTLGTDSTQWNGHPGHSDSTALVIGMNFTAPDDPYNYQGWDSTVVQTGFVNYSSENVPGAHNFRIGGLDPDFYYKIEFMGSESNLLSSANNNSSRTSFTIDGVTKSLATRYNLSSGITFDTLKSDASGYIYGNITGYDTTYTAASENYGIMSAMKISQISKTVYGTSLTELSGHYYDTVMIQDGAILRECNYYMPYNYNPSKKYGLIVYMAGQEQAVKGFDFDPATGSSYGLGYVAEHEKGKIYGLDANGDTVSYFILIPQYSINEYSGTPDGIDSIVKAFTTRFAANYNDTLNLVGFSSGGAATMNYLYKYPWKVKGVYVSSPAFVTGKSPGIPTQTIIDSSAKFKDYGVHVWLCKRPDGFQNNMDTLYKYIYAADSNAVRMRRFETLHRAFTWEYTITQQVDPVYEQTPYDFFANPVPVDLDDFAFFSIGTSAVQEPSPYWGNLSGSFTPSRGVFTGTDSTLHITVSTVSTSSTLWNSTTGPSHTTVVYPDQLYNYYANRYTDANGFNNTLVGSYEDNGYNILMTGCQPNTTYKVWFKGSGVLGKSPADIGAFYTPTDSVIVNQSAAVYQEMPVPLTETSDASGNLYFGMYAKQGQAFLNYIVIKKEE